MSYKIEKIESEITNHLSDLVVNYLNNEEFLKPFYQYSPNINSFKQIVEDRKKYPVNRKVLVETLKGQYKSISSKLSLDVLLDENTFTVTTGHQLCLFTGPIYFIYKIATTINLANQLKKEYPEYNFVPIYWMASEDHDIDEIQDLYLNGEQLDSEISYSGIAGELPTNSLAEFIRKVEQKVKVNKELFEVFKKAYQEQENLANATRQIVNELFGSYGLVVLDGNHKALKQSFSEIIKDEVLNETSAKLVEEQSTKLSKKYKTQVNPRAINLFYLGENRRERIEKINSFYQTVDGKFKWEEKEFLLEINESPQNFSPNVVLRPLYQEAILPNLAYVGGPSEIAYWFQLKKVFEHHQQFYPALILRNSSLLINSSVQRKMEQLDLKSADLFISEQELINTFIENHHTYSGLEEERGKLNQLFEALLSKANNIDEGLKNFILAQKATSEKALENIDKKIVKTLKNQEEVNIERIRVVHQAIFPNGTLQERKMNVMDDTNWLGKELIDVLIADLDALDFRLNLIFSS